MRIRTRHEHKDMNEKCPICRMGFQHFTDFEDGRLGCLACGCIFLEKAVRTETKANIVQTIKKQGQNGDFKCKFGCGFNAKSNFGKSAHERHCKLGQLSADGDGKTLHVQNG